jgi:DNA-binding response OmpR family regulator
MKKKIMVVDDDPNIVELISMYLLKENYEVAPFTSSQEAFDSFKREAPSLVLLDIMMPSLDGYQFLSEIRKFSNIPVIMITAKGETFDKVLGLELGADDYLVKPFDTKELLARIKAVIRRYSTAGEDAKVIVIPDLTIDLEKYTVTFMGVQMEFPPKEIELLYFLCNNPNKVFTREQLLDKIWGYDYVGESRTVDVHIKRIREKIEGDHSWEIKTVWGVGYKFIL